MEALSGHFQKIKESLFESILLSSRGYKVLGDFLRYFLFLWGLENVLDDVIGFCTYGHAVFDCYENRLTNVG